MKKIICKVTFDTETAMIVEKRTFGNFGDPKGYEETLYTTPEGKLFLYTNGGDSSRYKTEGIKRMSKDAADKWLSEK